MAYCRDSLFICIIFCFLLLCSTCFRKAAAMFVLVGGCGAEALQHGRLPPHDWTRQQL